MTFQLFDHVLLKVDVPDMRLKVNDIVTVVEFLKARRDLPTAYVVEHFDALVPPIALFTVAEYNLEAFHLAKVI